MREQRSSKSIYMDIVSSTNSVQEENKPPSKVVSKKLEESEEESEPQKEEEGKETSESEVEIEAKKKISNNKKKIPISSKDNNNNNKKQNNMNDNVSEEEEEEESEGSNSSEDSLSKIIQENEQKSYSKINIQSNGSKHKGKGVVGFRKDDDDDSTYDEEEEEESINSEENPSGEEGLGTTIRRSERLKNKTSSMNYSKLNLPWLDDDLLEESDNKELEMESVNQNSDDNESENSSNASSFYKRFKRIKKNEDEEINESQRSVIEINETDNNNGKATSNNRNLKLSHDQFFHPYRLENRIRMIEQTLQRTTWKEHLSETRINRLESKNYKLKQEYKQLKKQLKKQKRKEHDDTQRIIGYSSSPCNINSDQQIQNSVGDSGINFDYKLFFAGLVGFGLGGLASRCL